MALIYMKYEKERLMSKNTLNHSLTRECVEAGTDWPPATSELKEAVEKLLAAMSRSQAIDDGWWRAERLAVTRALRAT